MLIYQPSDGYCYNTDSIILFYFFKKVIKKFSKQKPSSHSAKTFLDIGSGSGLLGLLIKNKYKKFNSHICELQDDFCFYSTKNYEVNNFTTVLHKGDIRKLDISKTIKFDYIISNPPFYDANSKQCKNENKKIARYDDNLPLCDLLKTSKAMLKKDGLLVFCYRSNCLDNIKKQAKINGLKIIYIQSVYKNKQSNNASLSLFCVCNKDLSVSKDRIYAKNIYTHKKDNTKTNKIKKIYKDINTHSIKAKIQ